MAGVLSSPYLLQRCGNFDPGLEFKTAMAYADASSLPNPSDGSKNRSAGDDDGGGGAGACAVVLGDRDVQETLTRLGGAFTGLTRPGRKDAGDRGGVSAGGGGRTRVGVAANVGVLEGADVGDRDERVSYRDVVFGGEGGGGRLTGCYFFFSLLQ